MALVFSVPQNTYTAGQNLMPTVFSISPGVGGVKITLTNPSGWPLGDIATMSFDISVDNGATWIPQGGMSVNGSRQGETDPQIGLISGAYFKATFAQAANATTKGRVQAQAIKTFTTAIAVGSF